MLKIIILHFDKNLGCKTLWSEICQKCPLDSRIFITTINITTTTMMMKMTLTMTMMTTTTAVLTFPAMNVRCLRLLESRPVQAFTGRINPALRHITGILLWSRTGRPFRPCRCRSLSSAVVAFLLLLSDDIESNPDPQYSFASTTCTQRRSVFMIALLLLTGIEPNPGPAPYKQKSSIWVGTLNAWSAVNKGPLIWDIIEEHVLDALVITESWFNSDMSPAITDSIAPGGFGVEHFFRDGHCWRRVDRLQLETEG